MRYRVKVRQFRTTELDVDAPSYDVAVLRAEERLKKAPWKLWKMETEKIEVEENLFGDRKGDLFQEER